MGQFFLLLVLLTLPFSSGFTRTTGFQRDVYIVALLAADLAKFAPDADSAAMNRMPKASIPMLYPVLDGLTGR